MATSPSVHLVGSVPLEDAESVFRTVSGAVGVHLHRLPDGETGSRINWIRVIQEMLAAHPDMEVDPDTPPMQWRQWDGVLLREVPQIRFRPGVDADTVGFETPYADEAIRSYALFERLQGDGVIPADVKFQVSIPTPLGPAYNYVAPGARPDFIRVFVDHIVAAVARIADALPRDRLAIQWDMCQEVLMWEDYYDHRPAGYKDEIFAALGRVGDAVPEPVELGYHLCYGSPRDEHLVQPTDTANMVEMCHGIVAAVRRPIQFFHLPVPKDRDDDAYFRPLTALALPAETELLLGLVHYDDEAGDARRLAAARRFAATAGVSTECGWGRADPHRVAGYLASLRRAAESLSA